MKVKDDVDVCFEAVNVLYCILYLGKIKRACISGAYILGINKMLLKSLDTSVDF